MHIEMYIFDQCFVDHTNYLETRVGEGYKVYQFQQSGGNPPFSPIYSIKFRKLLRYKWYNNFHGWLFKYRRKRFVEKELGRKYIG